MMSPRPVATALMAAALLAVLGPDRALAGPAEERAAAQTELEALAPRIERLKHEAAAGQGGGAELERLLARAQGLAAQLERAPATAQRAPAPGPDGQELRERADALRDQADRTAEALAGVERRLAALARRAALAERLDALGATSDLFADSAAGKGTAGGARASGAVAASPGATPSAGAGVAPATTLRTTAEPGGAGAAPGSEEAGALRRRRDELTRSVASLRARAELLDVEARSAETR